MGVQGLIIITLDNHMCVRTKKDFSTNSDEGYNFFVAEQACWK